MYYLMKWHRLKILIMIGSKKAENFSSWVDPTWPVMEDESICGKVYFCPLSLNFTMGPTDFLYCIIRSRLTGG